MRDLLLAITDAGIPCQALNLGPQVDPAETGVLKLTTSKDNFAIKKHPLVLEILNSIVPPELVEDSATIAFWEFEDGFLPVYPAYAQKSHVIGMSDFVVDTMRKELPASVKVSKLLYPFRPGLKEIPSRRDVRKRFCIPDHSFAVFFNFDFASGFGRKNPDGAMRAFAAALRKRTLILYLQRLTKWLKNMICLFYIHAIHVQETVWHSLVSSLIHV